MTAGNGINVTSPLSPIDVCVSMRSGIDIKKLESTKIKLTKVDYKYINPTLYFSIKLTEFTVKNTFQHCVQRLALVLTIRVLKT